MQSASGLKLSEMVDSDSGVAYMPTQTATAWSSVVCRTPGRLLRLRRPFLMYTFQKDDIGESAGSFKTSELAAGLLDGRPDDDDVRELCRERREYRQLKKSLCTPRG